MIFATSAALRTCPKLEGRVRVRSDASCSARLLAAARSGNERNRGAERRGVERLLCPPHAHRGAGRGHDRRRRALGEVVVKPGERAQALGCVSRKAPEGSPSSVGGTARVGAHAPGSLQVFGKVPDGDARDGERRAFQALHRVQPPDNDDPVRPGAFQGLCGKCPHTRARTRARARAHAGAPCPPRPFNKPSPSLSLLVARRIQRRRSLRPASRPGPRQPRGPTSSRSRSGWPRSLSSVSWTRGSWTRARRRSP